MDLAKGAVAKAAAPKSSSAPPKLPAAAMPTDMDGTDDLPYDRPIPQVRTAPWRHQRIAYWRAMEHQGYGLFLDMGTGKTKVVYDLIINRGHRQVLVLAPRACVEKDHTWANNAKVHAPDYVRVYETPGNKTVAQKVELAEKAVKDAKAAGVPIVVVTNYETAREPAFAKWSLFAGWDLVVTDEAAKIKSATGKTSRYCWRLAQQTPYRLALTGTPMPHSPLDAFGIYRFINDQVFGTSYTAFKNRYAVAHPKFKGKILKWIHQEELTAKVYSQAYRVMADDVLDLPEYHHVTRTCSLGNVAAKHYGDLWDDLVTNVGNLEITADNVLVKLLRVQQITSGFLPLGDGAVHQVDTAKAELLAEVLGELQPRAVADDATETPGEPVVVFCRFVHDLDVVKATAQAQGNRYAEVSGRDAKGDTLTLDDWKDARADVIGVQIQAGGFGIDLTRARYAVYYSVGYSLGDYEQSLKRVHRPGQERPTTFVHLTARGTVDEEVYAALQNKRDVVGAILDRAKGSPQVVAAQAS